MEAMKGTRGMLWTFLPLLLVPLLGILAWLQFRWTGQLSVAEQERLQASLQSSVRRFTGDVENEFALFFQLFRLGRDEASGSVLADRLERYRVQADYPDLFGDIYVADVEHGLLKLDVDGELVTAEWPEAFERVRDQLSRQAPERGRRGRPPFQPSFMSGDVPVVSIPIASRQAEWPGVSLVGYTLTTVNVTALRETIFPELAERHFGADYDVAVGDGKGNLVFATPQGEPAADSFDARGALFGFNPFGGRPSRPGERGRRRPPTERGEMRGRPEPRGWNVFVRHRAGSLGEAVASARHRNLAVSFGVVGLLAMSIGLVVVSTRRASELNDRKMEFVAGVSHELRTPVAVIRSAGQNLADRSVSEPAQVERYGALIESEGRRLNDLVEQVLELAGIQSQKRRYRREPVPVEALVDSALRDCESLQKERGTPVTTSFLTEGAVVMGDPDALRRALSNLVMNAIKHGGDDNAVDVVAEAKGVNVALVVTDRGPGIPESERAHLFDAFYRGRRAQDRQVQGSGLGLSLVDHVVREHGGRVDVESTPGKGSRFTLLLPAKAGD
jgi:signal transduction histidine kinase